MSKKTKKITILIFVLAVMAAAGVTLSIGHADPGAAAPQGAPPPMPVTIAVMEQKPMRLWHSYSGRLVAIDYVELRPQVEGRIQEVRFEDGALVKQGDILFVIDPRPYQAAATEAAAALSAAKSQYDLALKEQKRAEDLIKTEAISQRVLDERHSTAKVAKNTLDAAQAQVERAQLNLDHAYLKAPVSGRVSRAEITVGNLVQPGQGAPVLTTIVSDEGIYADFEVDEQTYLKSIRQNKTAGSVEDAKIPVQMSLNDGSTYDGYVQSFDNRINTSTGTIRARAVFDNNDGALLPGMFATVKLGSASEQEAMLLTEQAIGTDQDRKFVYIVGEGDKVTYREVKLGASVEGKRIITSGLNPGDRVITDGTMKIMPDMVVAPKTPETTTAAVEDVTAGEAQ